MNVVIRPHALSGTVRAVASKSVAHRLLILAALASSPSDIACNTTSEDIEATARCLEALGARVERTPAGFRVTPIRRDPETGQLRPRRAQLLDCGESGSTLRFLLPVVCALGTDERLTGHGRLAERPLSPLYEELESHGAILSAQGRFPLHAAGRLRPGRFRLPGNVSSQYVSGLLMAAPLMKLPTEILVEEPVESAPYVALTKAALAEFGVSVEESHAIQLPDATCTSYIVNPSAGALRSPGNLVVEGDWSNAGFWLAAGSLASSPVTVSGLERQSAQGDRAVVSDLELLGARVSRRGDKTAITRGAPAGATIDVSDTPDLVMPLAAAAALIDGTTTFTGAGRLRLKESDRMESVAAALGALGATVTTDRTTMTIEGTGRLRGGTVDAAGDHRIAMMCAICAAYADGPTTIRGAECVAKSYPGFFDDFRALGGLAEGDA